MALKATVQKESPKQSLPKVTSEAAVTQMFFKIGVFKNFAIFIGKYLCWSTFLIKLKAYNVQICLKGTSTQVFYSYFPVFRMNKYSECRKIWTRKTPNTDTFYAALIFELKHMSQIYLRKNTSSFSINIPS